MGMQEEHISPAAQRVAGALGTRDVLLARGRQPKNGILLVARELPRGIAETIEDAVRAAGPDAIHQSGVQVTPGEINGTHILTGLHPDITRAAIAAMTAKGYIQSRVTSRATPKATR